MRIVRRRSAFGLLLMLLGGAAGSNGAEPGAATVTIGGEVRFKKKAPVFLRLTALDESGKEVYRHEGFYAKEDILAKWKELGVEIGS